MATKKTLGKTFAVKTIQIVASNVEKRNDKHTELVSLGEKLSWQDAVEVRKANKESWIHRENNVYPKRAKRVNKVADELVTK